MQTDTALPNADGPVNKFMAWLTDDAKGFWITTGYIVFAALVVISLDYSIENALINWGFVKAPPLPEAGHSPFQYYNVLMFITLFSWGPVKEEIIFRVLPLSIVIAFVSTSPAAIFGLMTTFAAIFGAIHPYGLAGKIQTGIAGFFYGLVFLKCGGLKRSFVKASVCAMAAHGLTNAFLVLDEWWKYVELTR